MKGLHFAGLIIHGGLQELLVELLLLGNVREVERELVNLLRIEEKAFIVEGFGSLRIGVQLYHRMARECISNNVVLSW